MTQQPALAMAGSRHARILDNSRRVEVAALLLISLVANFFYHPFGFLVATPLVVVAYILVPRERVAVVSREERRREVLTTLHGEGLSLRSRYAEVFRRDLTPERAQDLWGLEKEVCRWVSRSESQLKGFPELAFIFKFRNAPQSAFGELTVGLDCLERMRRLCQLSETLDLPI